MENRAHEVFAIPELLEHILLSLPPGDIILSQRTCKIFKTTVQGSTKLKRALFFEPVSGPMITRCLVPGKKRYFKGEWKVGEWACYETARVVSQPPFSNPMLKPIFNEDGKATGVLLTRLDGSQFPEAYRRREASWMQMFTTQPPTAKLELEFEVIIGYPKVIIPDRVVVRVHVIEPSGIRMHHVVQELHRRVRRKDCWTVEAWNLGALMEGARELENTAQLIGLPDL